ncbi:signal-transducing adaptor protein 1-like isoform X2 [Boleophthalmus pectinirostris]|uniref:signal-transducing adaptor protein 1-like isoform X2 n=1 Tax=Boleophthalmus pectinirostris TaxID=150288 RepID=UPI000A1C6B65|nr:signal-transducing adaptor protein 1-like isoform X2 [Boleophthalmus pectinirostris]
MAKRTGRLRHQLPHCYYEGYLEKRSFKDKYIEKVELSDFVSLTDDNSLDRNLDAARMTLQLKQEIIKITAPNAEARELWKGFIHSIAHLSVPSSLNLLPGQIHILKEALDKEKLRLENNTSATIPSDANSSPYINPLADMPVCYHKVNRLQAELMLERESMNGNLLLRPSGNGAFAVTTRQVLDKPEFKHYHVSRRPEGGFAIDVEDPIPCETLHDVINFFIHKTDGLLAPLVLEETYERSITFIQSDNENGEKSIQHPSSNPIPNVPPKPVQVLTSVPESESVIEEYIYLNDVPIEEKPEVSTTPPAQVTEVTKPPKKAIMPPVPAPRRISSAPVLNQQPAAALIATAPPTVIRGRCNTNPMGEAISELKSVLERKSKCLE